MLQVNTFDLIPVKHVLERRGCNWSIGGLFEVPSSLQHYFSHIATWKQEIPNLRKHVVIPRLVPRTLAPQNQELHHQNHHLTIRNILPNKVHVLSFQGCVRLGLLFIWRKMMRPLHLFKTENV